MPSGFVGRCTQSGRSTSQVNVCLHTSFPLVYLTGENLKPALHCTASQLLMRMCLVRVYVCAYGMAIKFTLFGIEASPAHTPVVERSDSMDPQRHLQLPRTLLSRTQFLFAKPCRRKA